MSEESEEFETEEEEVWECFGDMHNKDDKFYEEYCDYCDSVESCFLKSYGMTPDQSEWIEALSDNKPNLVSGVSLKPRKLRKISGLSVGFGIPSVLDSVYCKGSNVLTVFVADKHSLLFISSRSLMSAANIENLKDLFKDHKAFFRSVQFRSGQNVLLIPKQFVDQFCMDSKIDLKYDEATNTLFVRSNLSDEEIAKLELEKQKKSYLVHVGVKDAAGEKHGWRKSEEYAERERFKKGIS